jgi:hypothetical protein
LSWVSRSLSQGGFAVHQHGRTKPKVKKTRLSKCRDCGKLDEVGSNRFGKASSPRCMACGGIMDAIYPKMFRRTVQRGHAMAR